MRTVNSKITGRGRPNEKAMLNEEAIGKRARLKLAEVAVGDQPGAAMSLSSFLESIQRKGRLSRKDRLRIVEQALLILNMNYVHLPLKRAMHAVDPIQRLKLLRFRLLEMKDSELPGEMQFHQRMMEIFASTRDLHTMYLLPAPFTDHVAYAGARSDPSSETGLSTGWRKPVWPPQPGT